jgi:hypothetical protein
MIRSRSIVDLFLLLALYLIRCPPLLVAGTESTRNAARKTLAYARNTHILGLFARCMIHNVFHVWICTNC